MSTALMASSRAPGSYPLSGEDLQPACRLGYGMQKLVGPGESLSSLKIILIMEKMHAGEGIIHLCQECFIDPALAVQVGKGHHVEVLRECQISNTKSSVSITK